MTIIFTHPYQRDADAISLSCGLDTGPDSKTQQQFAREADINWILEQFSQGREIPENFRPMMQGDYSGIGTYQELQNAAREAHEHFLTLPAKIREEFQNDPDMLYKYTQLHPQEAAERGLLPPDLAQAILDATVPGDTPPPEGQNGGQGHEKTSSE